MAEMQRQYTSGLCASRHLLSLKAGRFVLEMAPQQERDERRGNQKGTPHRDQLAADGVQEAVRQCHRRPDAVRAAPPPARTLPPRTIAPGQRCADPQHHDAPPRDRR